MNQIKVSQPLTNVAQVSGKNYQRYLSLDVLRGLTIALMIVVNTPGSWETIYAPFRHAEWHGFTITDLVFPTFLFVVGNAMSFSIRKFAQQGSSAFLAKVLKRTAFIFLIGLFLNAYPFVAFTDGAYHFKDLSALRIMGVLQRIALCYGIAALAIHFLKVKGAVVFSVLLLGAYWAIMYFFGDQADPYSLAGNAALKFDLAVLPAENLYNGFGIPFDPEGLLSTLPAIVNVIAGYLAGIFIQKQGNTRRTITQLALAGAIFLILAWFWNLSFPINKPIWTSSYVIHTVGWDLVILAGLMLVIEVAGFKNWTYFFEVFGRNPLFIYAMSGIIVKTMGLFRVGDTGLQGWIYQHGFTTWLTGANASLAFAILYMLLLWLIGFWMDRKKVYVRV
jgi:predicted acyltransferase